MSTKSYVQAEQAQTSVLSTDHLYSDLKRRSVRGALLTLTSQGAQFLLQTGSMLVMARLLTPRDFGLVAMVTAVTILGQAFADLGLSEATIQRQDLSHCEVSNLFWINVGIGITLMSITAALAPVLSFFYGEPRLANITLVSSLAFLIGGLRVQHDALLKRQLRFGALAIRDVSSYVLGAATAITMAWKGCGYWAILALPLVQNSLNMVLTWLMARWIPNLPRRGVNVTSMVTFGGNIAASYFLLNLLRSTDAALIGRFWGAGPLGVYARGSNLLLAPLRALNIPIGNVALPTFSRLHADPERFSRYYLRTVNLMTWISAPAFGFLFTTAEPLIVLLLGEKWREAAPVFKILVISALGTLLHGTTIWLFVSRGESGEFFKVTAFMSPIIVLSYLVGVPFGIKGVALSGSLALIAMLPWLLTRAFRGTQLTLSRLWVAMMNPIMLGLSGIAVSEIILHLSPSERPSSQILSSVLGFGAAVGVFALIPAVRREALSLASLVTDFRAAGRRA